MATNALQQLVREAMGCYDALRCAGDLAHETQALQVQALALVQSAAAAYLPDMPSPNQQFQPNAAPRDGLAGGFTAVHRARSDLLDAIYRFAQAQLAAEGWPAAADALGALLRAEPEFRDAARLNQSARVCQSAAAWLNQGQPAQAAAVLKVHLKTDPQDNHASRLFGQAALGPLRNMAFVHIPAGSFLMGDDKRPTTVDEFWIGKYPLTHAQFIAFEDAAEYEKRADRQPAQANYPLVNVSWNDAVAFCQWASQASGRVYSLPSDEQWEKAARGTDGRTYPWGSQSPDNNRCNFNYQAGGTTPVGRYSPAGDSPYGCADMSGNVCEWVQSRCLRGGSFSDDAENVRCAYRSGPYDPDYRNFDFGFRVCVSPI